MLSDASADTNEVFRSIAANLRKWRTKRELTQETLAEKAGIDPKYLQNIEGTKENFSIGILVALASALELQPGVLFRAADLLLHEDVPVKSH